MTASSAVTVTGRTTRTVVLVAAAAAAVLALTACGQPVGSVGTGGAGGGSGGNSHEQTPGEGTARLDEQARQALQRWDTAVAAAGSTVRFVPTGAGTELVGEWEPEQAERGKLVFTNGLFEAAAGVLSATAPAPGEVRWADGTTLTVPLLSPLQGMEAMRGAGADCGGCDVTPARITAARLVTVAMPTNRGDATVPAWEYAIDGTAVRVTRVAVSPDATVSVTPPPWDPYDAPGGLVPESATVDADGRTVTLRFTGSPDGTGPCTARYTARAVESATAAVVIIDEQPGEAPSGDVACNAMGHRRTATLTLAEPLGDRTLLDVQQGQPVRLAY